VILTEGMVFAELAKVEDSWLWCNDRIDSMLKVGFDCFGMLVVDEANDRKENTAGGEEPIAWCG
jgi:hypothetical protein